MDVVQFQIEVDDPDQADAVAALLQERLSGLDEVEQAQSKAVAMRDWGTAVATVATVVVIARSGADIVAQVRRLIGDLRGIVEDIDGLRRVVVQARGGQVELDDIDESSDDEVAGLAATAT